MINIKHPPIISDKKIIKFFISKGLKKFLVFQILKEDLMI